MEEPNTAVDQQETSVEANAGPQTAETQDEAYQVLAQYAATLQQQQQPLPQLVTASAINKVPVSRKEEVHRLFGQRLVIKCDPNSSYSAPVVILASEEANIYNVIERHFKPGYLLGVDKFWKLVRSDMGLDTWRPRVQGSQLKALLGARLPEQQQEFSAIEEVAKSLQDCLKQDSSLQHFMADLHTTVAQIQTWWENRNKRPDGHLKRGAAYNYSSGALKKRLAVQPAAFMQHFQLFGGTLAGAAGPSDSDTLMQTFMQDQSGAADGGLVGLPGMLNGFPAGGIGVPGGATGLPGIAGATAEVPGASSFPAVTAAVGSFGASAAAAAVAAAASAGAQHQPHFAQQQQQLPTLLQNQQQPQQQSGMAPASNPLAALLSNGNFSVPVMLDVGGYKHRTTLQTLLAAQGSLFWQLVQGSGPEGLLHQLPNGDIFIDRNGSVFGHILEYLRACVNGEVACNPLPNNASELQALAREAAFYKLHDLVDVIHRSSIQPQPATRTFYDAILLETGFYSLAGPGLKAMEQSKVLLMEQLNHLLSCQAELGFFVEQAKVHIVHRSLPDDRQHDDDIAAGGAGAAGRAARAGEVQYNLQYHMLMKKVVPVLPQEMMDEDDPLDEEEDIPLQTEQQGVDFRDEAA